jgi:hypothetical protein
MRRMHVVEWCVCTGCGCYEAVLYQLESKAKHTKLSAKLVMLLRAPQYTVYYTTSRGMYTCQVTVRMLACVSMLACYA